MRRYLGQYIYHDGKFNKRGFLQLNSDGSYVTRVAKPGEEWGNTKFVNGILFPVLSDIKIDDLKRQLLDTLLKAASATSVSDTILDQIESSIINRNSGDTTYWFAFSGIDLSDLKTFIKPSIVLL